MQSCLGALLAATVFLTTNPLCAQDAEPRPAEVQLHLAQNTSASNKKEGKGHETPVVAWLMPTPARALPFPPHGRYTLMQRDRMFTPHLLVVPVGSVVLFPNADPFFHNVFSLFDGKRFDLGLYEAGATKEVTFSREGLSYIFCNIHPEMSAVVLALSTPLYAIAEADGDFHLHNVPAGEYDLHVWVEGESQPSLDRMTRRVHVSGTRIDLGTVTLGAARAVPRPHTNKFGQSYDTEKPIY